MNLVESSQAAGCCFSIRMQVSRILYIGVNYMYEKIVPRWYQSSEPSSACATDSMENLCCLLLHVRIKYDQHLVRVLHSLTRSFVSNLIAP